MPTLLRVTKGIKDAAGAVFSGRFRDDGLGNLSAEHHPIGDDGGLIVGARGDAAADGSGAGASWTSMFAYSAQKLGAILTKLTQGYGSAGADHSVAKPDLPNVGANFGGSGPYASYQLLKTVPANPNRAGVEVFNNSTEQVVVVRDDGVAPGATAPQNATPFALAPAVAQGGQGGTWRSTTFRGRLQVYAPAGTEQIIICED
jgi:hypothetical protein